MYKIYSLLFLVFSSILSANDQATSWIAPLADRSLLLDIEVINDNKLVAVGEFGHILLSEDGTTWNQSYVPLRSTLTSVFFLDQNIGWAVGHDATILNTVDGGNSWHIQQYLPNLEKPLFDIVFKDKNNGLAVGSYGLYFTTNDGGKSWVNKFQSAFLHPDDAEYLNDLKIDDDQAYLDEREGILPHFNRITVHGDIIYLVGEIGLLGKSTDYGATWEKLDEIYQGSFFDVYNANNNTLLVCGLRGNIFRSEDGGDSWSRIESDTTSLLNSFVLTPQKELYLLGNNGVILKSNDLGKTFSKQIESDGKSLIDGVWYNDKLIIVTDIGIKQITALK